MNRKIKYSITDLKKWDDEKVIAMISEKAEELQLGLFGENLSIASEAMVEFNAVWNLQECVNQDGFDFFFLSYGIDYGKIAVKGFERIGAGEYKKVTQVAMEDYKNVDYTNITEPHGEICLVSSDFYDLTGLEFFLIKYIRKNYEEFVIK
ncbi:DMP19 family protein [Aquimarina mytili]|uniref:DNA mimic protein DMP19 C-terminal domain-containing protein n=1 Tax=Aquimarina mytili TaxID=874423 RepID=A0A936ZW93_9FLAO|nr:hypothetical protein [Aquimarina mytili]MBL0683093.1 hypothetical protein [Aquimarina mytili]